MGLLKVKILQGVPRILTVGNSYPFFGQNHKAPQFFPVKLAPEDCTLSALTVPCQ